jgi:hypothetical protein
MIVGSMETANRAVIITFVSIYNKVERGSNVDIITTPDWTLPKLEEALETKLLIRNKSPGILTHDRDYIKEGKDSLWKTRVRLVLLKAIVLGVPERD